MLTYLLYKFTTFPKRKLQINKTTFSADIADTLSRQMIGLMYRKGISDNSAMLLCFGKPGIYGIWMLNMKFAIDIVWLDSEMRVLNIEHNAKPCRSMLNCEQYTNEKPAKYVLELNSGLCKKLGIRKGAKAHFLK